MDIQNRFIRWKSEGVLNRSNVNRDTWAGVRENRLVKNNITRDIDPTRGAIKTLIALMQRAIGKENTHLGTKLWLVSIILAKNRPASTPKNPKRGIIGLNMKQAEQGRVLV